MSYLNLNRAEKAEVVQALRLRLGEFDDHRRLANDEEIKIYWQARADRLRAVITQLEAS